MSSTFKKTAISAVIVGAVFAIPISSAAQTKYDIAGFKTATGKLVLDNCTPGLTQGVAIETQVATCKSLIPQLRTLRSNFVGAGFDSNFRWADDRMNWQISKVYTHISAKYLAAHGNNINPHTCGYAYPWRAYILKMDENPREFFNQYDKMLNTVNAVIEKCKGLGHVTAME